MNCLIIKIWDRLVTFEIHKARSHKKFKIIKLFSNYLKYFINPIIIFVVKIN